MTMSQEQQDEQARAYRRVVAKAWRDEPFRQRLLANPTVVAAEEGLRLPTGVDLKVVENTDRVMHLVLPRRLSDLSDAELAQVAGGFGPGNEAKGFDL